MSIQDIFYLFGIVYMFIGIIVMIVIGYVLFAIKNNIDHLHDLIDRKINNFSRYTDDPADAAIELGSKVANAAVKRVKKAFTR